MPQWSPPLSAGAQVRLTHPGGAPTKPQWSPPIDRREHDGGPNKVWGVDNEPQWSPPLTGGSLGGTYSITLGLDPSWVGASLEKGT